MGAIDHIACCTSNPEKMDTGGAGIAESPAGMGSTVRTIAHPGGHGTGHEPSATNPLMMPGLDVPAKRDNDRGGSRKS
jgi:hypothetical protein